MQISKIEKDRIKELSIFSKDVFIDYYNDLIGNKQARYMADLFLSEESIEKLIDQGAIFIVAEENNEILGFSEYLLEENKVFLSKLYVSKNYRNQGIGKMMLDSCIEYSKENNIDTIYLTVNKNNTSSINVYKHCGFKIVDSVVNDIGNNYVMDDYIMELSL